VDGREHIVLLSGGKDSTAMALRLAEVEPRDYIYLCTPTGNELPDMVDHFSRLEEILGQEIVQVTERTLYGIIMEQNMIPNFRARFCTRMLKIEPFKAYLLGHLPAVAYVGLRADEAEREGVEYTEPQIREQLVQRYPLTEWEWGLRDVMAYLNSREVSIPERTDCAVCFFQRLDEWWRLWRDQPEEMDKGIVVEEAIGYTFRSDTRDTWPAALKDLKGEFERGRVPRNAPLMDDMFHEKDRIAQSKCRMCSI
jgi:3'-phosphoadenosine 5'-phosphosulfate sulfotransferase (PAPS reductase)/FAD synthetase